MYIHVVFYSVLYVHVHVHCMYMKYVYIHVEQYSAQKSNEKEIYNPCKQRITCIYMYIHVHAHAVHT